MSLTLWSIFGEQRRYICHTNGATCCARTPEVEDVIRKGIRQTFWQYLPQRLDPEAANLMGSLITLAG